MRPSLLALLLLCATGCASRSDIRRMEFRAEQQDGQIRMLNIRLDDAEAKARDLETKISALTDEMLGPWTNPDCARRSPEAQRIFCKREGRFVEASKRAVEKTNYGSTFTYDVRAASGEQFREQLRAFLRGK